MHEMFNLKKKKKSTRRDLHSNIIELLIFLLPQYDHNYYGHINEKFKKIACIYIRNRMN